MSEFIANLGQAIIQALTPSKVKAANQELLIPAKVKAKKDKAINQTLFVEKEEGATPISPSPFMLNNLEMLANAHTPTRVASLTNEERQMERYRACCEFLGVAVSLVDFLAWKKQDTEPPLSPLPLALDDNKLSAINFTGKNRLVTLSSIGFLAEEFLSQFVNNGHFNKPDMCNSVAFFISEKCRTDVAVSDMSGSDTWTLVSAAKIDTNLIERILQSVYTVKIQKKSPDMHLGITVFLKVVECFMVATAFAVLKKVWNFILDLNLHSKRNLEASQIGVVFVTLYNRCIQTAVNLVSSNNLIDPLTFATTLQRELDASERIKEHFNILKAGTETKRIDDLEKSISDLVVEAQSDSEVAAVGGQQQQQPSLQ